jgi:hypothetical protein
MDQEEAHRPSWSLIFGGVSYMILFLAYTTDANNKQRIAIFCSDILSTYHDDSPDVHPTTKLPICSAIVYMLLSTHDPLVKASLKEKLGVGIEQTPPALHDLGKRGNPSNYSMRLQPVCRFFTASSDITHGVLARIPGSSPSTWFLSPNSFTPRNHHTQETRF